jgi:glutamate-5-semialdehyde dehydrogenase
VSPVRDEVAAVARAARAAVPALTAAPLDQLDAALAAIASGLESAPDRILEANAADVAQAEGRLSAGLVDRLRLDETRLSGIAAQVRSVLALPTLDRTVATWSRPDGLRIEERRVPIGVVGAIYEARPNVTVDMATQLLKSRNAGVLRTGGSSLRTAVAMIEAAVGPALAGAGLPAGAIGLVRSDDHAGAEALVSMPELVPVVIIRGSGETTRHLAGIAARADVRTLQHAEGGGFLYVHAHASLDMAQALIRASLDRLGVCNRLNWLAVDADVYDADMPSLVETLASVGVSASLPPHDHPLSHEWALDADRNAVVTVVRVAGVEEALEFAHTHTSGLAAAIVTDNAAAAGAFLDGYRGTGGFWNATTRWLDGYALTGAPETGINVDKVPGPRGPVTYRDLYLRQFVVTGDGTQHR